MFIICQTLTNNRNKNTFKSKILIFINYYYAFKVKLYIKKNIFIVKTLPARKFLKSEFLIKIKKLSFCFYQKNFSE